MDNMDNKKYITLFTARIGNEEWDEDANIVLFDKKEKITDAKIVEVLFLIKARGKRDEKGWEEKAKMDGIRACFNALNLDEKIKVITDVYVEADEKDKKTVETNIASLKKEPNKFNVIPPILKKIWEKRPEVLINKAPATWSLYRAHNHEGVYVVDILNYRLEEKTWFSGLYQLAKAINPSAQFINIVSHQKDTIEEHDYVRYTYSFPDEEVSGMLNNSENVRILSFSHTTSCPVYLVLKEAYENNDETISESVDSVHRQISYIAKNTRDYLSRLNETIKKTKDNEPFDPFVFSYK